MRAAGLRRATDLGKCVELSAELGRRGGVHELDPNTGRTGRAPARGLLPPGHPPFEPVEPTASRQPEAQLEKSAGREGMLRLEEEAARAEGGGVVAKDRVRRDTVDEDAQGAAPEAARRVGAARSH